LGKVVWGELKCQASASVARTRRDSAMERRRVGTRRRTPRLAWAVLVALLAVGLLVGLFIGFLVGRISGSQEVGAPPPPRTVTVEKTVPAAAPATPTATATATP
jgi:hypothetical protein